MCDSLFDASKVVGLLDESTDPTVVISQLPFVFFEPTIQLDDMGVLVKVAD